ncbi:hypothetical protein MTO96_032749 [Rhipicephalus appendiculatus]
MTAASTGAGERAVGLREPEFTDSHRYVFFTGRLRGTILWRDVTCFPDFVNVLGEKFYVLLGEIFKQLILYAVGARGRAAVEFGEDRPNLGASEGGIRTDPPP